MSPNNDESLDRLLSPENGSMKESSVTTEEKDASLPIGLDVGTSRIVAARGDRLLKPLARFAVALPLHAELAHLIRGGGIFRIDFHGAPEHLLGVREVAEGHMGLARIDQR